MVVRWALMCFKVRVITGILHEEAVSVKFEANVNYVMRSLLLTKKSRGSSQNTYKLKCDKKYTNYIVESFKFIRGWGIAK